MERTAERGPRSTLRIPRHGRAMTGNDGRAVTPGQQRGRSSRAAGPGGTRDEQPATGRDGHNQADIGWAITGYLMGGIVAYGGAGWLIGHWVGYQSAFMAGGVIIGVALALTLTILRHGRA